MTSVSGHGHHEGLTGVPATNFRAPSFALIDRALPNVALQKTLFCWDHRLGQATG